MSEYLAEPSTDAGFPDPFNLPVGDDPAADQADEDLAGDEVGDDSPSERSSRHPVPQRALQAAQRKAVLKTIQVVEASKKTRAATAALLGVASPDDVSSLTLACLSAGKAALRPVRDVLEVAKLAGEPFKMMEAAVALADNEPRFKAAWDALANVSSLGRQPANTAKAGVAFATAVAALTDANKDELQLPEQLIG